MDSNVKLTSSLKKPEFWLTVVTSVSGLLLAFGVITPEQSNSIAAYAPNVIGAVLTLLSTMKYIGVQHEAKVEVFRAMCAANIDKDDKFTAQGVSTPEDKVSRIARMAGL